MTVTTENINSAILGYWRSGASLSEISKIVEVPISTIMLIITNYEAKGNDIKR